jgi:BirA family biotin operon repressor/biotin-[acetyl-CoA-carboxylase] ligase
MGRIGYRIVRLDEVPSTNTLILENDAYLDDAGLVVIARHQTAGRGRIGRRWASLPGAQLQFSVVAHPTGSHEDIGVVSLIAGLSTAEAIEQTLQLRSMLKWPNDVQIGGRKVCGILTESKPGPDGQARLVIGIGINCAGTDADFPGDLRGVLTTLQQAAGRPVDSEVLLQSVLARLDENLASLSAGKRPALLQSWRERANVAEKPVRFSVGKEARRGRTAGIDDEGRLVIRTEDGALHVYSSGEVEWLD